MRLENSSFCKISSHNIPLRSSEECLSSLTISKHLCFEPLQAKFWNMLQKKSCVLRIYFLSTHKHACIWNSVLPIISTFQSLIPQIKNSGQHPFSHLSPTSELKEQCLNFHSTTLFHPFLAVEKTSTGQRHKATEEQC